MPSLDSTHFPLWLAQVLCVLLFAITFLQSSLDKVFDWKGNVGWMTPHFSKGPLRGMVVPLLFLLTLMELAAGFVCAAALVPLVFWGSTRLALVGVSLCAVNFVALFSGLRLSKDYAGAAGLVPYFLAGIVGLLLMRG